MSRKPETVLNGSATAQRGLLRLLLKLPAIRGKLQIIAAHSSNLNGFFEAYEEAQVALQRFRTDGERHGCALIDEYEGICADIETDVLLYVQQDGLG